MHRYRRLARALTFTYNGSRLSQISDWSGRTWQYTVDANGDLVTFKNPLAVAGSQNPVTYQYYTSADGANLAHAMKRYQLPRGNGMGFEYYQNGRVFRHTPFGTDGEGKPESAPPSPGPSSAAKRSRSTGRATSGASSSTNTATRLPSPTKPALRPPTPTTPPPGAPICASPRPRPTARPPATPTTPPATSPT
ncbi:hypothetical protein [Thauera sinica]|uniref:hypothetical protein n=1 Tax=Thauera sp. K11 TaxID=2005884 RepID=UPI001E3FB9CE|nr:hypothetical protein [Thauera sp. K11]